MHKGFLKIATVLAAFSIALGAFGAHSLKEANLPMDVISIFETGVRYQFYHVFALLIAAILFREFPYKTTIWACRLFLLGIILFSGSLYFLTWVKATDTIGLNGIGAITPIGGLAFIAGWLSLLMSFFKKGIS